MSPTIHGGKIGTATPIEAIKIAVAEYFNLPVEEFHGPSRARVTAIARQLAMFLAHQLTELSIVEIGSHFGNLHHTSIRQSIAVLDKKRRTDPELDGAVQTLIAQLQVKASQ